MNDKNASYYIKGQKDKITAWQEVWQEAFESGESELYLSIIDDRVKTIKSSLSDFMDALNNG